MVVMAATWAGRCRVCGCVIPQGVQIEWTKDGGARHLTPEECEAAQLAPPPPVIALRGPGVELSEERARVERLLLGHPWKTATTMPRLPHQYSLRRLWDDADFVFVVEHIRAKGYEQRFIGRTWVYYDVGEHQYWDCGGAVTNVGLINRAVRRPASARSKVASGS